MSVSYLEVDDHVLEGLSTQPNQLEEWRSKLPRDIAERVWAVVVAPGWYDRGKKTETESPKLTTERPPAKLEGYPLAFAILAVVLLVGGVLIGVLAESVVASGYFLVAALVAFALCIRGHVARSGGFSNAFGLANSQNFIGLQVLIFVFTLTAVVSLVFIPATWAMFGVLAYIDRLVLPQDDKMSSAAVRFVALVFVGLAGYRAWPTVSQKSTATLRRLRGCLVFHLPAVATSWMYEPKSSPKPDGSSVAVTVHSVALKNLPLIGAAVVCGMFVCNLGIADKALEFGSKLDDVRNMRFVFLVSQWVGRRPNTLSLAGAILGPVALAIYTNRVGKVAAPTYSREITAVVAVFSLVVFFGALFYFRS